MPASINRAQAFDERLPLLKRQTEMRGAGREIGMVQVIGLDAVLDEGPHQGTERPDIGIDALEQHRLAQQHMAGIGQRRDRGAGVLGELARMVGVDRDVAGLARNAQRLRVVRRDPSGIDDGHAGVPARDLDVRDRGEALGDLAHATGGENEGIAARHDHLPDLRTGGEIGERRVELGAGQGIAAGADHFAPEAEAAIDWTDRHGLE
jgi:hypothetical protein